MRRRASVVVAFTIAALAVPIGDAFAEPGVTSPNASCVAILSNAGGAPLPGRVVGQEVSGFATSAPGVVGEFSRSAAQNHAGSLEGCIVE